MKLSRTVTYALRATLQLAAWESREPVPCSRLAAEGQMPERFLLQVLRSLVTHGILHSTRGVEGGYSLERRPEEISLLEVIEAIEGPLDHALPCEGWCDETQTKLRDALDETTRATRRMLEGVKLADLLPTRAAH